MADFWSGGSDQPAGVASQLVGSRDSSSLRPGLDFTGGTQIQLERRCEDACGELKAIAVSDVIRNLELPEEEGKPSQPGGARVPAT